jgi:hypothetical protein
VTNAEYFEAAFSAPANDTSRQPNFSGQYVSAISVPSGSSLKIEKATIIGNTMRIYAISCNTESLDCPANGLSLITTPRSSCVKKAQFFINEVDKKVIILKH